MHPIVETTAHAEGQEAILCEGNCSSWYHRWCAGVTALRYEELSDSDEPFHCPTCIAKEQQQTISELHHSVQSLQEEVREMKIAINALQEKDAANAPSLLEDVSELKAIVASLQVLRAESPAASELPDNTPTWSEVARRKPPTQEVREREKGVKMEREIVVMEEGNNKVFQPTVALVLANQKAKIHSTKVKVPVSFDPSLVNTRFGVLEKLVQPILSKIPSPS